jgi:hypothetical protein
MWHETTDVSSPVEPRGTPATGSGPALLGGVHPAALPDPAGQRARAAPRADCPATELRHPERAPCHSCLAHPRASLVTRPIPPSQAHPRRARRRAVAGGAARTAPRLGQSPPHVDPAWGRGGLLGTGPDALPGQHRDDSPSAQAGGRELAARQALDHQPRSPVRLKKSSATG